jgi:hypothetical protein
MSKKKTNKWSLKKVVYVLLAMSLGKILGFLAFEILSLKFVRILEWRGLPVEFQQVFWFIWSPLPGHLFWILIWSGVIAGFFAGLHWWQIIYVEKRHWRK